jgi:signal transduction histidine kinase
MVVSSDIEPLSAGTEERLTDFTELLATAIENAEAREAVQRLADEQAALRRVATLVAEAAAPSAVLDAVAGEMQALLGADEVALNRFEPDTEIVVLAHRGLDVDLTPVGSHVSHEGENVTSIVRRTGSPARMENYERAAGALAELARSTRLRSSVSAPITVEGQVWGLVTASWKGGESPPADTEDRMAKFAHLIDTAIANTEARAEIERLADEQAALRHVATLVAEGVGRAEVFAAVSEQVARVFRLDVQTSEVATAVRFDPGPESVLVGTSKNIEGLPLGSRWEPKELYVSTKVLRSRRPSRLDEEELAAMGGPDADELRRQGFLSQVGSPILAEGRLWGAITVNSGSKLPPDAEQRLEKFTELIATAISNAESREDLSRLAQEQAALRRVATLVARETAADAVFAAVGREVGQLLGVDATHIGRYDPDGTVVSVAQWGSNPGVPIGARFPLDGDSVSARVLRTGRPARMDYYESAPGVIAATMRQLGIRFSIGVPISIEGRPWGVMIATSEGPSPFPTDIESRLQDFTELVATSIANAENRSELASSRARIVAASDDARRRIERDLHDGVQQQLVSLRLELGGLTADPPAGDALREQLAGVTEEVGSILDALVEIARGIHPAILSHGGLEAALHSLARRSAVPVTLEARIEGSLADEVEVAAYYVASEALTNVAKHARASVVHIDVTTDDGTLTLAVRDDGVGGADLREGSGLVGLRDRIEALGGTIAIDSPAERGTRLLVTLPLATEPDQEVGR